MTNCARATAPRCSRSTPPAQIAAGRCSRAYWHEIHPGETLVVVRLDRLARSVSHLLAVIEQLEAAGAHFRSLRDPIDTTTPQGMFSLQVLGAVAQIERALSPAAIPVCAPATRTLGFMQLMLGRGGSAGHHTRPAG